MEYEDELDRMRARKNGKRPDYRNKRKSMNRRSGREDQNQHKKAQMQRMRKKRRKRKILLAELILLFIVVIGAFLVVGQKTHREGYWTIAIFGVDSRDGNLGKGALSDVEMICSINKATGEIRLLSVFRDTYLKIDESGHYDKINQAYARGGHKQALAALNENLDLQIDDYATFNWKSVADTINILQGIDLEITDKEFKQINSFITETVESTGIPSKHLERAGMNHLDGVQAVAYARLRLMDTDFNRTERQRKVVSLMMEKAKNADFSTLNNILVTVLPHVKTSIGVENLLPLAKGIHSYYIGNTGGFPFSRTPKRIKKKDCVIPTTLESNVVQLHQFLFDDLEYTAPSSVRRISDQIGKDSGLTKVENNAPTDSSSKKQDTTPKTTDAPETTAAPEETETTKESVEETKETLPETTQAESLEPPTLEDGSLVGPGADIKPEKESTESSEPTTAKPVESSKAEIGGETKPLHPDHPAFADPGENLGPGVS